jgi:NitT/TauT family transport system substrate-binding protein
MTAIVLGAATVLGATIACSDGETPVPDASGGAPDRVRAIVMPYLTLMPLYIAQQEGYFARQNLEVEFVRVARNQEIMASLASDDVDVAAAMLTTNEINLIAAGTPIRMIAALGSHNPDSCVNMALVARRELVESGALEDPDRIRELVFDTDPLIPVGYWTDVVLQKYGLSIDDVELANMPSPAAMAALRSGSIDVTLEGEPFITMLEATGEAVIWERIEPYLPGYVIAGVLFGPDLLERRPEVAQRFTNAVLMAIRQYALGKTPRNVEIVSEASGMSPEQVRATCWPYMPPDARIVPSVFDGYQQWSLERGLIDRTISPDEMYDPSFIERANELLDR